MALGDLILTYRAILTFADMPVAVRYIVPCAAYQGVDDLRRIQ